MTLIYRSLRWVLYLCMSYVVTANAQFIKNPLQFESEITDIVGNGGELFVATADKGLFVSQDGGVRWQRRWLPRIVDEQAWSGYLQPSIYSLAFINARFWAMTSLGMYVSDDRGHTWRRVTNPHEYITKGSPAYTSKYYKIVSQDGYLFVSEGYFDSKLAKYGYRLLVSADNGESWSIAATPGSQEDKLTATDQMLLISAFINNKGLVYASKDRGQSWQSITDGIPFEAITAVQANGQYLLVTGQRTEKNEWGDVIVVAILATSVDGGQNWKTEQLPAVNFVPYSPRVALIHKQKFIIAMNNQLAYSDGDGRWAYDSLGLLAPNYTAEGGVAVINDTLWVGYKDRRLQSEQFSLPGYLLSRPVTELSTDYAGIPALLRADGRYRETVILDWQAPNTSNRQYSFYVERAEGTPDNFRTIALATGNSFVDTQAKHGKLYYYRIRADDQLTKGRTRYTPLVSVFKPNLSVRAAYLNYFEDLQMPTADTLFARAGSEIVRSVDGGKSWSILNPCYYYSRRYEPNYGKYISISFPTNRIGYVMVGTGSFLSKSKVLMKTLDGGETWTLQNIQQDFDEYVYKICFVNELVGYALTDEGYIYKTTNGGLNFRKVPDAPRFTTLQYKNRTLVGGDYKGHISFSFDQGQTWASTNRQASAAHIFDAKRFVISSAEADSVVVRTTSDGGSSWQRGSIFLRKDDKIYDIQFINEQRGFLIGGYPADYTNTKYFSFVYQTTDGGRTWTYINTSEGVIGIASEMAIRNNRICIIYQPTGSRPASSLSSVLLSEDGGKTWKFVSNLHSRGDHLIQSVSYRNEKEGILITNVGSTPNSGSPYHHYYTKDGGLTWLRANLNEPDISYMVRFISADVGFRVGDNVVYYTLDGAKSWEKVNIRQFPLTNVAKRVFHAPNNNGLTHGGNIQFLTATYWVALSDDNRLYVTTDRGQSWRILNTPTLRYPMFYFVNERIGYVTVENKAQGNQLWKTTNGGSDWTFVVPFDETSLFFLTETIGFAGLKRTSDGGKHWYVQEELIPPVRVASVAPNYRFLNNQIGYVGPSYYTTDGGAHWATLTYLSESTLVTYFSTAGPPNESPGTLVATDRYYGGINRLVPANVPCNPLAIVGDTLVFVDKTTSSAYSAKVLGWEPGTGLRWSLDGGGNVEPKLTESTINWNNKVNAVRTLSVQAVNDRGASLPATLKITTKLIITALEPIGNSAVNLYPNPAHTTIFVELPANLQRPSVTWYDQSGRQMSVPGNLATGYDVAGLPVGVYLIRIHTDQLNEVKRVIVSR